MLFFMKATQDCRRVWQQKRSYIGKKNLEQENYPIKLKRFFSSMLPDFIVKGDMNEGNHKDNI